MACQSCQSGCDSCNFSCQGCVSCYAAICESCQSFCQTESQIVSSCEDFHFKNCGEKIETDSLFFTRGEWNKIFTYLNNAYSRGTEVSGKDLKVYSLPEEDTNEFMTADMFNEVSNALAALNNQQNNPRNVNKEDVIYGSYFDDLERYASSLEYNPLQCNYCNAGFDAEEGSSSCESCYYCNNCNACISGQQQNCCSECQVCNIVCENQVIEEG